MEVAEGGGWSSLERSVREIDDPVLFLDCKVRLLQTAFDP